MRKINIIGIVLVFAIALALGSCSVQTPQSGKFDLHAGQWLHVNSEIRGRTIVLSGFGNKVPRIITRFPHGDYSCESSLDNDKIYVAAVRDTPVDGFPGAKIVPLLQISKTGDWKVIDLSDRYNFIGFWAVEALPDGGAILALNLPGIEPVKQSSEIVRLDSEGTVIWSSHLDGIGPVLSIHNNFVIFSGTNNQVTPNTAAFFVLNLADGSIVAQNTNIADYMNTSDCTVSDSTVYCVVSTAEFDYALAKFTLEDADATAVSSPIPLYKKPTSVSYPIFLNDTLVMPVTTDEESQLDLLDFDGNLKSQISLDTEDIDISGTSHSKLIKVDQDTLMLTLTNHDPDIQRGVAKNAKYAQFINLSTGKVKTYSFDMRRKDLIGYSSLIPPEWFNLEAAADDK